MAKPRPMHLNHVSLCSPMSVKLMDKRVLITAFDAEPFDPIEDPLPTTRSRLSISVSSATYNKLSSYSVARGIPIARVVESLVKDVGRGK